MPTAVIKGASRANLLDLLPPDASRSLGELQGAAVLFDPAPKLLHRSAVFVGLRDGLLGAIGECDQLRFACLAADFSDDTQGGEAWPIDAPLTWSVPRRNFDGQFLSFLKGNGEWVLYSASGAPSAERLVVTATTEHLPELRELVDEYGIELLVAPSEDGSSFLILDRRAI